MKRMHSFIVDCDTFSNEENCQFIDNERPMTSS